MTDTTAGLDELLRERNEMRLSALIGLLAGLTAVTGCATPTRTPQERSNVLRQVVELDLKQLAEDWDHIWLVDRQSRLTKWYTR